MIKKSALTDLTKPEALFRVNEAKSLPGAVVEMIEQENGKWTVTIVWDDSGKVASFQDLEAFHEPWEAIPATAQAVVAAKAASPTASVEEIGGLSRKFESNGKPGAIGHDTKGGYSYGSYQIATRTGTMEKFISFLSKDFSKFSNALQAVGGNSAAISGSNAFRDEWIKLAKDPDFSKAQHEFIKMTHYEPFAEQIARQQGLDVTARSSVLRDVVWSVAVQHGSKNTIFKNALGTNADALGDRAIVEKVYEERSKVDKYFPSSNEQIKAALVARFQAELRAALQRLSGGV